MSYKRIIFKLTFFTVLLLSVLYIFNFVTDKKDALANINTKQVVEVFKTPSCGCCYGYVLFLEEEKFKVKQTDMRSLHTIKQKYNIPVEMQSCHTTILGKYFIEGHVPFEAVDKLLKEQPDIDGIALPGMPIGTPGMPGDKDEPICYLST
jgi:Predicted metal-binding protein